MLNKINANTTTTEERKCAEASMLELKMLLSSGLLLWSAYKTAIVHPCDGFIPCNKPKMIIPEKMAINSCNYGYSKYIYIYYNPFWMTMQNSL